MTDPLPRPAPGYDEDYYAWSQAHLAAMRARDAEAMDWGPPIEQFEDLGNSDPRQIESCLDVLLLHLLKWAYQPAPRKGGWQATIIEQRTRILRVLRRSPSLRSYPAEILAEEYALARPLAAAETGLPLGTFPEACPFAVEDVLREDWLPDAAT